jgi:hypothetical protein
MIYNNIGRTNLSVCNLYLPGNVILDFSKAGTKREMQRSLCKGAKAVIQQTAMYGVKIKPISQIFKTNLGNSGMYQEAAEFSEEVEILEAEEAGAAATVEGGTIFSAEALEILEAAEIAVQVALETGLTVAVGTAAGASVGPAIGVGLVIAWALLGNHASKDKRKLLDEEFRKLFNKFSKLMRKPA